MRKSSLHKHNGKIEGKPKTSMKAIYGLLQSKYNIIINTHHFKLFSQLRLSGTYLSPVVIR